MQKAKVISSMDLPDFSQAINQYLADGYRIQSANLGPEKYVALLVIDEPSGELYTLTATKENISMMLLAMCDSCRNCMDACIHACILSNHSDDKQSYFEDCIFTEDTFPDRNVLFDRAVAAGLIRKGDA